MADRGGGWAAINPPHRKRAKIGEGPSMNMYKAHMDKVKGGKSEIGKWGWVGKGARKW